MAGSLPLQPDQSAEHGGQQYPSGDLGLGGQIDAGENLHRALMPA